MQDQAAKPCYAKTNEERLTPSPEEQTMRILAGKCPHNKGWRFGGHGHNDDAYTCTICGETEWI